MHHRADLYAEQYTICTGNLYSDIFHVTTSHLKSKNGPPSKRTYRIVPKNRISKCSTGGGHNTIWNIVYTNHNTTRIPRYDTN